MPEAKPQNTESVLKGMFTENTGTHFLDSGGAYGRHWQKNQDGSFKEGPSVRLEVWGTDISGVISTYHFLKRHAEFEPKLQRWFDEMANPRPDDSWGELVDDFPGYAREAHNAKLTDPDDAGGPPASGNTYNNPRCWLGQELQYTVFSVLTEDDGFGEHEDYALIRLHNGCDVRGGYTKPRAFRLIGGFDSFLIETGKYVLIDGEHYWDYDGSGWIGAHPDAKRFGQYSTATAAELLGLREELGLPEAAEAYETIQNGKKHVSLGEDRLSETSLKNHEEKVKELQKDWFCRLQEYASNGVVIYFNEIEPPEFVEFEQDELILSPETGDPLTACV